MMGEHMLICSLV